MIQKDCVDDSAALLRNMKMNNNILLQLICLVITVQRSSLVLPNQLDVEEYIIVRRNYEKDLFTLTFKNGSKCSRPSQVSQWCNNRTAGFHGFNSGATNCSCACTYKEMFRTFQPQMYRCIDEEDAKKFGGCADYFTASQSDNKLMNKAVDMSKRGSIALDVRNERCSLQSGDYFDYSGFQIKWKSIRDKLFSFTFSGGKVVFQWQADRCGSLSGRIIRLRASCYKKTTGGSASQSPPHERCMLFKASGTVTYSSRENLNLQSTCPASSQSSLSLSSTLQFVSSPPQPSSSYFPFSSSFLSSLLFNLSSLKLSPPSPTSAAATALPLLSPSSVHKQTMPLNTLPSLHTSESALAPLITDQSHTSMSTRSEEASDKFKSSHAINHFSSRVGSPEPIEPSKISSVTKAAFSSAAINVPPAAGDKDKRTSGKDNGVVIGAGVGGAIVFGIIVTLIVVFCKHKRPWKNKEKAAKLDVKNPVYGKSTDEIQLEGSRKNQINTYSEEGSQLTYQTLNTDDVSVYGGAVYSNPEDNYDNHGFYQSLEKKVSSEALVYQSLQKEQSSTGNPTSKKILGTARPNTGKPSVPQDPVYIVLEESDTRQGDMSEALYNGLEGPDPSLDPPGNIQDPVYNVLDGPDVGQTYEAPDVGVQQDPLYNVLEVPESKQEHQEPLYNVLESADTEIAHSRQEAPHDGAVSERLYNVLDGADSGGANVSGAEYASPNRPLSSRDNPAYEQTLEFGVPNAVVHSPGSQRESFYEPLEGSDRQDVYEPLQKRGNNCT